MTTQTTALTALGVTLGFSVQPGQSITYSSSGTFTGDLRFQRSRTQGASWETIAHPAVDTNLTSATVKNETNAEERYRARLDTDLTDPENPIAVSGTCTIVVADAEDTLLELKAPNGQVFGTVNDSGLSLPGTLTVAGAVALTGAVTSAYGVGAKNGATVSVVEQGDGVVHKTIITCTATPVTITDDAGVAQYGGTGKLYDFPEGLIATIGAVIDGAITLGTTGTITTTWAGGVSLGTATATTGATLVSTEADILPEVDVAAATASVATVDAVSVAAVLTESAGRVLDGTTTAKDLFLNLVVDDEATHTSGTGTFTGTVTIVWLNLGDK